MTIDHAAPLVDPLTRREREILRSLAGDLYSHEIAEALTLSPNSIKWYTRQIYAKLGVHSRKEAIRRARELGLLETKTNLVFHPHNLPAALTPFVGRQAELAQVRQMLVDPVYRLLTLTGAGGVGKTRLALRAAEEQQGNYPDGACLVELASLSDSELVPQTVAAAFDLHPERDRPSLTVLVDFLCSRNLLLVLDNCEHLVAACASLAHSLLLGCPALHILATSREALGIEAERTYLVPSLSFPAPGEKISPEILTKYDAIDLFTRRAKVALPDFELDEANTAAVTGICRHLDGIPLALELAAARLHVMDVDEIASQLEHRFHLLSGGDRTAPPRLQTMHASIDWSYQLLSEAEKSLLRCLSVFAGGWSLAAAKAVWADKAYPEADILDLLGGLVNKSLVQVLRRQGRELTYRLLETIRQYLLEKLSESGEAETIRDQHLGYFLTLAERAEGEMHGVDQKACFDRLEGEHDNFRAALTWSQKSGEGRAEAGLRVAGSLWWFWYMRGYIKEGCEWLEKFLSLSASQAPDDLVTRAKALCKLGWLKTFDEARIEEGLALARTLGPAGRESMALAFWGLGLSAFFQTDYIRAKSLEEQGLKLFRELGNRWGICVTLAYLGMINTALGEYQQAEILLEQSLQLARQARDGNEIGHSLWILGLAAMAREDYGKATALLEESLAQYKEIKNYPGITFLLSDLGRVAKSKGDPQQMASFYKEVLALHWELGYQSDLAWDLEQLARAALVGQQPERAARLLGAAQALRESSGAAVFHILLPDYESFLEALRPRLDEANLAALWAEGRAMMAKQAVAYALSDLDG